MLSHVHNCVLILTFILSLILMGYFVKDYNEIVKQVKPTVSNMTDYEHGFNDALKCIEKTQFVRDGRTWGEVCEDCRNEYHVE